MNYKDKKSITFSLSLRKDLAEYLSRRSKELGLSRSSFLAMIISEKRNCKS